MTNPHLLPNTHISAESAYVVDDYPYGFRLRCTIRYWLEFNANKGFRFWSQTTNPKRGGAMIWNKPKCSTYSRFGAAMFLDEKGHVQWSGLHEYTNGATAKAWRDSYGEGVPEAGRKIMNAWVESKLAYDATPGEWDDSKRLAAGRAAFYKELKA